jgi:hypothetical protein
MRLLKVGFNYLFKLPYGLQHEGSNGSPATDHKRSGGYVKPSYVQNGAY